ncbi:hypothetical protein GCM10009789_23760 [Kribbella sancticallisti]|uniref:Uncharacterized protein n=1 Tax=Kribbella sancticallisti TaxID=460087 RepID=A0ABP4NYT2_9ACTN
MLEPLPGSPAPTTVLPSVLQAAAERAGTTTESWPELFQGLLSPDLVQLLLVAFRHTEVEIIGRHGFAELERLDAVTVNDGLLRLTPLGVRGLFAGGRWADPSAWLLDPGEWWANLSAADLAAFLEAAAQLRLVDQAWTVQRWFDQAPPLQFAFQLVLAGRMVEGAARNVAFGYLLRIGLAAAPAVEEWLVVPAMAAWARLWFDLMGAPRPGVPTDEERGSGRRSDPGRRRSARAARSVCGATARTAVAQHDDRRVDLRRTGAARDGPGGRSPAAAARS